MSLNINYRALSLFYLLLKVPIHYFESRFLMNGLVNLPSYSPIFIIGAPRTGSTILYQVLTNTYDVKYIDNLASKWYRNLLFGMWLSHRKFVSTPHNNFYSLHGNTNYYGGHAPSECGEFWYRWLAKDHHFIDHHEVSSFMIRDIENEVNSVSKYFQKPIIFKNLNAGQRLRLIAKVFPNAYIIFIRRDPRFIVRSILNARIKLGVREGEWWGIMPKNYKSLLSLPVKEMVAAQVYYLEKQIIEDLNLFPSNNVKELHYQDFSVEIIDKVAEWMHLSKRPNYDFPVFNKDDVSLLNKNEFEDLDNVISKFPFDKKLFV